MDALRCRNFSDPGNEVMKFEHGKAELMEFQGGQVRRLTAEKGWRWTRDVSPQLCPNIHLVYQISGVFRVQLADGTQFDLKPGDVALVPAGHDAWVIGDETVVNVDLYGALEKGKK